ncbi:hypothetical protein QA645_28000 [Bradyrhizobium sp. CIAT3101]|uniref:hypothetical protein n=1 Tax=Bradyrhizobium sp. CIAT3101 TaxID=439387 RepID=UPI0024B1A2B8|nr:hypothetical protein [Bradyrhizobium sp. CIAT3101]WFU78370.1 hypothetical protein QA645_28000 [Bradyrhizobium sp. CIAT3101]
MIYVVDVDHMSLAFAASSKMQAAEIAGSPRFARAIGRSWRDRRGAKTSSHQPRVATVQERVAFHDMSAEFADAAADVLVARVG